MAHSAMVRTPEVQRVQTAWDGLTSERKARLRTELMERDGACCKACGATEAVFEIDHVVAISDGGSNETTNLQVLCVPCHKKKTSDDHWARKGVQGSERQRVTGAQHRCLFMMVPNLLDTWRDSSGRLLDPFAVRVYLHYVNISGTRAGVADETVRETADLTGISTGQVHRARHQLAASGWITMRLVGPPGHQLAELTLVDRWAENCHCVQEVNASVHGVNAKESGVHVVNASVQVVNAGVHGVNANGSVSRARVNGNTEKTIKDTGDIHPGEPSETSTNGKVHEPKPPREDVQRVFAHYQARVQPTARRCPTDKIKARLKFWTVEDLLQAIDHFAADAWWMEHNATRGGEWFFHSDARIEQFVTLRPRATANGRVIVGRPRDPNVPREQRYPVTRV